MTTDEDELLFVDDEVEEVQEGKGALCVADEPSQKDAQVESQSASDFVVNKNAWKILVVDDDEEIHFITKLALKDFVFDGKKIEFVSAFSGEEAKQLISEHKDTALILLDVVMEDDDAGLKVVKYIREVEKNSIVRIILRTGQPGQAPENKVIIEYDINDYKTKTELTAQKLISTIVTALRSYRDITSRIQAQGELGDKTKQLQEERDIFISGPVTIFKWANKDGFPVEYASPNVKEVYGYSVEEFLSGEASFLKMVFPEDLERLKNELKVYGDPLVSNSEHEYRITTKDGRVLWLNHFSKAIRDADGKVTHFYGYIIDATKKKELELLFFESATEGIILLDENRNIQSANTAMCEILNVKKDEIVGKIIYDFLDEENKEVMRHIDKLINTQSTVHRFEIYLKREDGTIVPALFNPAPIKDLSGKTLGVLAFVIDLTEQKKMEEELRHAMRAEKRFIATMSHEIRTPLTSILGFVELLRDTVLVESQKELVQNISVSSQHLLSLINSILDVSKVEAGQLELTQDELNLNEVLSECGIIVSNRVKPTVRLAIDIPELDYYVYGDQLRIKQIFVNLLGNASKFTEKGHIKLYMSQIKDLNGGKVFFEICVEDTGMGIPEDKQQNLFQPFKQAHGSKYGGTGLGLYLARSFARLMDGDIRLESKVGVGTKFFVSMILKKGGLKEMQFDLSNRVILYVEDEQFLLQQFTEKFKKVGATLIPIDPSKNILEIMLAAQEKKPDVVVLDMDYLKERSGNIASALKEILPNLPIIGTKMETNILDFKEIKDYMPVPFTFYRLASVIAEQLKESREKPKDFEKLRVLLAEDVEINQELARKLFRKFFNLEIDTASDGVEAVEKVKNNSYDVVFMDMNMPNLDGTGATQQIRSFNATLPIIALTANAYAEDIERAYQSGMNGYVTKPFEKEKIQKALLSVVFGVESEQKESVPLLATPETNASTPSLRNLKEEARVVLAHDFEPNEVVMLLEQASSQTKKILADVEKGIIEGNIQNLSRAYHSLKGMLLSIKLQDVADLAKDLELACRNKEDIEDIKAKNEQLKSSLKTLISD